MHYPALTLLVSLGSATISADTAPLVENAFGNELTFDSQSGWTNLTDLEMEMEAVALLLDTAPKILVLEPAMESVVPLLFPPNVVPASSEAPLELPLTSITNPTPFALPPLTEVSLTSITNVTPTSPPAESQTLETSPTPVSTSTNTEATPKASWIAPANFSDLSTFKVQHFASGEQNLKLVNGIPASASDPMPQLFSTSLPLLSPFLSPLNSESGGGDSASPTWDNSSTAIQLLYPATSSNPSGKPVGGAEIYFSPLDLSAASNVTLSYSVFFPFNFDWVLAGKLPGLYGGHMGCSGGNDAKSCFSTRMMWRQWGAGELYLYAPKDKQNPSLCKTPPQSVCNDEFGFSIGRGSFHFSTGKWTHIKQTVGLNTPGQQDGLFVLFVNGELILNITDILYRDGLPGSRSGDGVEKRVGSGSGVDELLGGLNLGGLLPSILGPLESIIGGSVPTKTTHDDGPQTTSHTTHTSFRTTDITTQQGTKTTSATSKPTQAPETPFGFSGVFFSTFFGGHGEQYATPRDQFAWFKDFAVQIDV